MMHSLKPITKRTIGKRILVSWLIVAVVFFAIGFTAGKIF